MYTHTHRKSTRTHNKYNQTYIIYSIYRFIIFSFHSHTLMYIVKCKEKLFLKKTPRRFATKLLNPIFVHWRWKRTRTIQYTHKKNALHLLGFFVQSIFSRKRKKTTIQWSNNRRRYHHFWHCSVCEASRAAACFL